MTQKITENTGTCGSDKQKERFHKQYYDILSIIDVIVDILSVDD